MYFALGVCICAALCRVSLTAPPLKEGYRMERPALWEIRLHFADALRCSTVFVSNAPYALQS